MNSKKKRQIALLLSLLLVLVWVPAERADADGGYGTDAYAYMEYLQGTYPGRAVGTPNLDAAAAWLKQEVSALGYSYASQPFSVQWNGSVISGENLIFSRQGASNRVIVVGAHYDCVGHTNGTDDNATGVGVLLECAKRLAADASLPYTVRFLLFSAEEPGCLGSQYYVDSLSAAERQNIVCMINLDTIGAGDNMYVYGGGLDGNGQPVRTWAVEQALAAAKSLGLPMSCHPDVNAQFPVPVKYTASDQQGFDRAGIPYIYFEASNWNGGNFTNFYQTANPAVVNGKMMHVAEYENLPFYTQTFGNRIAEHLSAYSALLDYLLHNLSDRNEAAVPETAEEPEYEACSETVWASCNVNVRSAPSASAQVLGVLAAGHCVERTGYHTEWSRVNSEWGEAYIRTEFLTQEEPETQAPAEEETQAPAETEAQTAPESEAGRETEKETAAGKLTEETAGEKTENAETTAVPDADRETGAHPYLWGIAGIAAVLCGAAAFGYRNMKRKKRKL